MYIPFVGLSFDRGRRKVSLAFPPAGCKQIALASGYFIRSVAALVRQRRYRVGPTHNNLVGHF